MSIAEKLITIANNTPAVCASLATKKSTITGNPAFASDVSSNEHNLEVKLVSKNLLDLSKCKSCGNGYGFTTEFLEDDVIRISGTATATMNSAAWNFLQTTQKELCGEGYRITPFAISGMENFKQIYGLRTKNEQLIAIQLNSMVAGTFYDMRFKLMVSISTPTLYTPHITEFNNISVSRLGKNLIPRMGTMTTQWNGMTVSYDEEADTYTINGTCTGLGNAILSNGFYFPVTDSTLRMGVDIISGSYTSAGSTDSGGDAKIAFAIFKYGSYDVYWANRIKVSDSITAPKTLIAAPYVGFGGYICTLYIQCWDKGCVFDNFTFRIYTDRTTSTGYEQYIKPQTAITNTEGVAQGLTSLSPNMTLFSDDNSVIIDCTYKVGSNPTANKKYTELQDAFAKAKEKIKKYL